MKLLGRGWQYGVYDLDNGRVVKKYNSWITAYAVMLRECFPYTKHSLWKLPRYYRDCRRMALEFLAKLEKVNVEPWMLGNPKVLDALDYEQDKVIPLREYLDKATLEEGRETIDKFVAFNKELVGRCVIDKRFNIAKNFGMDAQGRVILTDLGEVCSDKENIMRQIQKRIWTRPDVLMSLSPDLQGYFVERMDTTFLHNVGELLK